MMITRAVGHCFFRRVIIWMGTEIATAVLCEYLGTGGSIICHHGLSSALQKNEVPVILTFLIAMSYSRSPQLHT